MAKKQFNLETELTAKIDDLTAKLNRANGQISNFKRKNESAGSSMQSIWNGASKAVGAMGLAFGAIEIKNLIVDSVKLAATAEGVSTAFFKIAKESDLNKLRESVKGTVSDLELMKRAVSANNFGIPVQTLGKLFEFASKRAQDTGQSVDYLVDSIVTGIGRKSPLILDNLGISAAQLKSKLNGVSMEAATVGDVAKAVGAIADDSLKKTGGLLDTTAIKVAQLSTEWENAKAGLGKAIIENTSISKDLSDWTKLFKIWGNDTISTWDKVMASMSQNQMDKVWDNQTAIKSVKDFTATINSYQKQVQPFRVYDSKEDIKEFSQFQNYFSSKAPAKQGKPFKMVADTYTKQVTTLDSLNEKLTEYNTQLKLIDISDSKAINSKIKQIASIENQIQAINKLKNFQSEATKQRLEDIEKEKKADIERASSIKLSGDYKAKGKVDYKEKLPLKKKEEIKNLFQSDKLTLKADGLEAFANVQQQIFDKGLTGWAKMALVMKGVGDGTNDLADTLSTVGEISGNLSGIFNEQTVAYKAFAIAQASISTYLAASQALADPKVPAFLKPFLMGSIIGLGLANVAKIAAFETGGIVGGSLYSGDKVLARVNSGEMILNSGQQANLFKMLNTGNTASGGEVVFRIEGNTLVGVLNNHNKRTNNMK